MEETTEESSKQEIFITEDDEDVYDEQRLVISDDKHTESPFSSADEDALDVLPSDSEKMAKNDDEKDIFGVQPPEKDSPSKSVPEVMFSWPEYLKETGAIAAPEDCFYQDPVPPKNNFIIGKKVVVPDPRALKSGWRSLCKLLTIKKEIKGKEVQCLATVVAIHSLWICLRLDGEDGSNDHWLICDDERIKPVGECDKTGLILQPPFGYMYNLASFHKFIENQLKPAADGSFVTASSDCFKPIPFKYHPRKNRFEVGMKCEAIDHKNFNGRPCPATVIDIKGDYLTVSYDGWNKAYDSRERYDSRFIFPVEWAAKCGLDVQPPNRIKGKVLQRILQKDTLPKAAKITALPKPKMRKRKAANNKNVLQRTRSRKRKRAFPNTNSHINASDNCCSSHMLEVIDQMARMDNTWYMRIVSKGFSLRDDAQNRDVETTFPGSGPYNHVRQTLGRRKKKKK